MDVLIERGEIGATASEIASEISYPRDSVSPRMKALARKNKCVDSGTTRPGLTGRAQIVWLKA